MPVTRRRTNRVYSFTDNAGGHWSFLAWSDAQGRHYEMQDFQGNVHATAFNHRDDFKQWVYDLLWERM